MKNHSAQDEVVRYNCGILCNFMLEITKDSLLHDYENHATPMLIHT